MQYITTSYILHTVFSSTALPLPALRLYLTCTSNIRPTIILPPRLQVRPILIEIESRPVRPVLDQLHLIQRRPLIRQRPQANRQRILPPIIDDPRREREQRLRSDMRQIMTKLVPVHKHLHHRPGPSRRPQLQADRHVQILIQIELEGRRVESAGGVGYALQRGRGACALRRGVPR